MKTIFITITRGFIVRNILRSGVLKHLKESGCRIVIFIQAFGKDLPDSLRNEFNDEKVIMIGVPAPKINRLKNKIYRIFSRFSNLLFNNLSTWTYSQTGTLKNLKRPAYKAYLEKIAFTMLSRISFFKKIVRYLEEKFYIKDYEKYFDQYKPSLVFSTSIISKVDMHFMKTARRRGIKTISMPKGWDNTKFLYRFAPDKLIAQNNFLKERAVNDQKIKEENIIICGFPQFDWYRRKDIIISREDFFSLYKLDPDRRLIFFGSEGCWASNDDNIAKYLVELINKDAVVQPSSLLIRPHFSDVKNRRFDKFVNNKNVRVDDNFTISEFFHDNWDPGNDETKKFINAIYHCDIMITVASTLALDACCFNKPIITVAFNALFNPRTGKDVSALLYKTDHYQEVLKTNGVDIVYTNEELVKSINNYLIHPEYKNKERLDLLNKLCYKVDGKSSLRIANAILKEIN